MLTVRILEEFKSAEAAADALRHIAGLLDDGFTSGHYPGWELDDAPADAAASRV